MADSSIKNSSNFESWKSSNLGKLKKDYDTYIKSESILSMGFTAFCNFIFGKKQSKNK